MLEVYNESVYDLLHATGEDLDLQLKPKSEEVHVKGLSWEDVNTGRPGRPTGCAQTEGNKDWHAAAARQRVHHVFNNWLICSTNSGFAPAWCLSFDFCRADGDMHTNIYLCLIKF